MNIEKTVFLNKLFDYYEKLLTQRQQEVFRYYYQDDLSYQEIADILGISRAAVFDNLNRTSKLLIEYEEKLGLNFAFFKICAFLYFRRSFFIKNSSQAKLIER